MTAPSRSPGARVVRRAAPAKLNLYLHVTGERADGLHLLDSLVAFAGVHDTVAVRAGERLRLRIEGPFAGTLSPEPDNLVLRAARALAEAAGREPAAQITLTKRLPVASGIGGGSADAAATLEALAELWALELAPERLMEIGLSLGADVPVCLAGRASFVGGVGEILAPAPALPPAWVMLANPGIALSTAEVFASRRGPYSRSARFDTPPRDVPDLAGRLAERRNDLSTAAAALSPEVGRTLGAVTRAPGCWLARMSGSGATCFGLFDAETPARRAGADLRAVQPDWWVESAPLLTDVRDLAPA